MNIKLLNKTKFFYVGPFLSPYISEIVQATANLLEDSRQELSEEFNGNEGLRLTHRDMTAVSQQGLLLHQSIVSWVIVLNFQMDLSSRTKLL